VESPWTVQGGCSIVPDDGECVTSPNFPQAYPSGASCTMSLIGHKRRFLEVVSYDVEQSYDDVYIDGRPLQLSRSAPVVAHNLTWSSDASVVGGGWQLCARVLPPSTEESGPWVVFGPCAVDGNDTDCVTSPGFPGNYGNEEVCSMAVRSDTTRYLEVVQLDVVAPHDSLTLGSYALEAQADHYSGRVLNDTVRWRSDKGETASGWKICARGQPIEPPSDDVWRVEGPCEVDDEDEECIESPSYPENYGNNEACTMSLRGSETRYLTVDRYDVEEGYDYLTVGGRRYDSSQALQPIEGDITWTSDESVSHSGWRICARLRITTSTTTTRTFVPGSWYVNGLCETEVSDGKHCVTSPNFPDDYDNNQRCELSIFGGVTKYLEVAYLDELSGYRADTLMMGDKELSHRDNGRRIGEITWSADGLTSVGGAWKLCALDAPKQEPGTWEFTGPCELDPSDEQCMMSPGFPGSYGEGDQRCTMWIYGGAARYLEIVRMDMETGYPPLFMGSKPVFSDMEGALIHPVLSWSAAETGTSSVWKVCARERQ